MFLLNCDVFVMLMWVQIGKTGFSMGFSSGLFCWAKWIKNVRLEKTKGKLNRIEHLNSDFIECLNKVKFCWYIMSENVFSPRRPARFLLNNQQRKRNHEFSCLFVFFFLRSFVHFWWCFSFDFPSKISRFSRKFCEHYVERKLSWIASFSNDF